MDSDDECVVFEGTPLHQSLVDSGMSLSEFEILKKPAEAAGDKSVEKYEKQKGVPTLLEKAVMTLQTVLRVIVNFVFPLKNNSFEEQYNRMIAYDLLKAGVLEEDDREFLENYLEGTPAISEPEMEQLMTWKSKLLIVFMVPSLVSYGYQRTLEPQEYMWNHYASMDLLAVLTTVYLLIKCLHVFVSLKQRRSIFEKREIIRTHAKSELSFLRWMKKCLRLIQETELVARGFTLVSQKSPVSLIEQSQMSGVSSRQCPELRKLLFHTAREAIIVCRESTKTAITRFTISPEIDAASSYLAFQSLQSYGPCLQKSASEEKELFDLTDGFSVAALKGMVHLCHLQQSEFIKRLVLIFDHSYRGQQSFPTTNSFQQNLASLTDQFEVWCGTLDKSYSFHNSYLLKQEPKHKVVKGQMSPYGDINIAVHSLDLHLQAALTRVRALSLWLEKLDEESQSVDTDILSHDSVAGMMQPIKAELDSCKGCWEEGISRMEKLLKQKQDIDKSSTKRETTVPVCKVESVNIIPVEDPIIVDQVFEAFTDDDHIERTDYSWEQPLTAEEKEKKKRAKEEALRMLKELKSVITVRSQEMERREADALKRYKNQTTETSITDNQIENLDIEDNHVLSTNSLIGMEKKKSILHAEQSDKILDETDVIGKVNDGLTNASGVKLKDFGKICSTKLENIGDSQAETQMGKALYDSLEVGTSNQTDNIEERGDFANNNGIEGTTKIRDGKKYSIENLSESEDFLDISGGTSQKSLKISNLRDKLPSQERTDVVDEVNLSEKSSSFMEVSNTDIESAYSAISYTSESDQSKSERTADICYVDNDNDNNSFEEEFESVESEGMGNDEKAEIDNPFTLEERLQVFHGANLSFTSNIAALAVAKSQTFGFPKEATFGADTFGDESDDDDNR